MDLTRKAGLGLALLTIAGLAATAPVQASTPGLYSTGVNGNGTSLTDGTPGDPHYTLTFLGTTYPSANSTSKGILIRTSVGNPPYPLDAANGYIVDSPTSAWIGPSGANNDLFGNDPNGGYYDYQTTFTLPVGSNAVTGLWATDNAGVDILVNGHSSGNTIGTIPGQYQGYKAYTHFTLSNGFNNNGSATVDFIVYNEGATSTALRVDSLQGATVAPEPSSFAVFGFLGLGMAGLMLKARKRSTASATA